MKLLMVLSMCLPLASCEAGYDYSVPQTRLSSQYSSQSSLSSESNQYQVARRIISTLQGSVENSPSSQQYQTNLQFNPRQGQEFSQQYEQFASEYSQLYSQRQMQQRSQQQQVAQVHKHVYVHVAPEEKQSERVRKLPLVAPPQKHYKIIFIKAPSAPAPAQLVLPQQSQSEEKTLVYVLSKNAEEQEPLVLPAPAATPPSKPEVYFIKYKTQKEQFSAVADAESQFEDNSGAPSAEDLESISVESALRANDLSRLGGRAHPIKYGTPEFQ